MKRIAISQSNYIPWKGYFDMIHGVDEFVLYDDVQFTRRDWRNRNQIKTQAGKKWLTIPVETKGKFLQKINETRTSDADWALNHWASIKASYSKAAFFHQMGPRLEALYKGEQDTLLSRVNYKFLRAIMELLGIATQLRWSSDYALEGDKSQRLLSICKQAGATTYVSGPSAKDYLDEALFKREGVRVEWMDYEGYPPYRQMHGPFEHAVSVIDLLLNEGPNAQQYMKSFAPEGRTP